MAIFLDSGFFMGLCHPADENHQASVNIFRRMSNEEYGMIYTSPYVIAETATLMMIRTRNNQEKITKFFGYVYGENSFMDVLPWSADLDLKTFTLFQKVNSPNLEKKEWRSFVDVSNIAFCQEFDIDMIAAFDGHFDLFLTLINA
jgi:predicted nucleic acid-binding protein